MLRLSARNRFQIPVPDERRAPHLTVIQGGLSFRKEKDSEHASDMGLLVYWFLLHSWMDARRRKREASSGTKTTFPVREETGVRDRPFEPVVASLEAIEVAMESDTARVETRIYGRRIPARSVQAPLVEERFDQRSLYFSKRVLRQYVRRVLRHDEGLEDYLRTNAWELMKTEAFRRMPYELVREHVFDKLTLKARDFARNALATDRRTRKGYEIRTARFDRQDFVITFHHQQPVVIGIYTRAHFDRLQKSASSRGLSSLKARIFRQNKPGRHCR